MTLVLPPDIEEDITAEQVADWLLTHDWLDVSSPGSTWRTFGLRVHMLHMLPEDRTMDPGAHLTEVIERIANVTRRHPSAVLADIVGPARAASVGQVCAVGMDGPWLWGECNRLDGKCRDSAANGAGEESQER